MNQQFLFYINADFKEGDISEVPFEEVKHLKVLRFKVGDHFNVTNGNGCDCICQLTESGKFWRYLVKSISKINRPSAHLSISIAPTKQMQRLEWMVEKCTEVGITEITPIICENSERKVIKSNRLENIAITAMKQSRRFWKPIINPLLNFNDYLNTAKGRVLLATQGAERTMLDVIRKGESVSILIGPEGGFSKNELLMVETKNLEKVKLSNSRLRTETAAIVACTQFNQLNL